MSWMGRMLWGGGPLRECEKQVLADTAAHAPDWNPFAPLLAALKEKEEKERRMKAMG